MGKVHTRVPIQVGGASGLAPKSDAIRINRSLQRARADRTKVDGAFRDMAGRRRGDDFHGQPITIHKRDIVVVQAISSAQSELGQGDRRDALRVTVKLQIPNRGNGRRTG